MPLNREQILAAAFDLLREGGLGALSMRKLADRLSVQGATLYHHFPSKRVLLDHLTEDLLSPGWRDPLPGESWQEWMLSISATTRDAMLSCKDGAKVCAGSKPTGSERSKRLVHTIYQPLLDAGFSHEEATFIRMAAYRFTLGWTLDEQAAADENRAPPTQDREAAYRFGLGAMIRGLAGAERAGGRA